MRILEFPDLRQMSNYDCGATAVQSVLAYYGIDFREEKVLKMAGTTKDGTPIEGIKKILKHFKLRFREKEMDIEQIKKCIRRKIPVIMLVQAWADKKVDWANDWNDGHYVVAIGYSQKKIYFEDPAAYNKTYLFYHELRERWHDIDTNPNGKKYFNFGIPVYGKKIKFDEDEIIHMD